MAIRPAALALASLLAACVPPSPQPLPPPPAPAPTPVVTPPPAPTPTPTPSYANWMDAPQTPGDWRWRNVGERSVAEFVSPGDDVAFRLECGGHGHVALARTGAGTSNLTIRSETATRPVSPEGLPASDPLLDAIAFSRGRFVVEVSGQPTLYLPAWPEITRVIEDCRD